MAFPDFGSPSPTKPNEGKTPQGGLGEMMKSILGTGGAGPQGGPGAPPPQPPGMPGPGMPQPMGVPPVPGMPGPGGPMQGAGMQPQISPEEYQAILEQIKGELMKDIAGQTGQQDRMFAASAGLSRYRPMQGPHFGQQPAGPTGMPQDVQYPPGMNPQGLSQWNQTGNPNPGMGRMPQAPPVPLPNGPSPRMR